MNDETGGKPESGYGSGDNSGSPVATPEETAAMLMATAKTLADDFKSMCGTGSYAFGGTFCQTLARESIALRFQAIALARNSSLRIVGKAAAVLAWTGDRGGDVAKGARRAASLLGRGLQAGSSVAGKYLPAAGKLAQKLAPLAKASGPIAVIGIVVALPGGKAAAKAAVQALGGAGGAAIGAAICSGAAIASLGAGAASCLILVPVGGALGSYGSGWLFSKAAG